MILAADGPLVGRLQAAGIHVEVLELDQRARTVDRHAAATPRDPRVLFATLRYVARLRRRLRELKPDLVHTNTLKAGVYGSLAARAAGVPVVWHVRDRIADDYMAPRAAKVVRALVRTLPSAVVTNSQTTLDALGRAGRRNLPRAVVSETIEPPQRRLSRPVEDNGAFRVGIVGRLAPWKGQDLFIRAFAQAFPAGSERCSVIGAAMFGEDDFQHDLERLVDDLDLTARTEFRGFQEDVWRELSRLDVLVHASRIPEPFGQVVLEAMAAGVPVVAADAGGPAEIVHDGSDGLLYPVNDEAGLTAALRRLREDSGLREAMAAHGRVAVGAYAPSRVAGEMQAFYRRVLQRSE